MFQFKSSLQTGCRFRSGHIPRQWLSQKVCSPCLSLFTGLSLSLPAPQLVQHLPTLVTLAKHCPSVWPGGMEPGEPYPPFSHMPQFSLFPTHRGCSCSLHLAFHPVSPEILTLAVHTGHPAATDTSHIPHYFSAPLHLQLEWLWQSSYSCFSCTLTNKKKVTNHFMILPVKFTRKNCHHV